MLPREARWFASQAARLGDAIFPALNVGSHTAEFRSKTQPWIDQFVFGPFAARGREVVHTDIQAAPGVDLVGDLTDPAFQEELRKRKFRSAFCNNLLEHVENPECICRAVAAAVEPGGYLFLSVPHKFPYHADPIDTMFRPSPEELAALFPGTEIVAGEALRCGNLTTYAAMRLVRNSGAMLRTLGERLRGRSGADRAKPHQSNARSGSALRFLPWLVRPFVITCLVLRVKP
jgi:SAM-dependent methyltransferase